MAHLHVPDGMLPGLLWLPAWVLAVVLLILTARSDEVRHPRQVAYRGALGALALGAMALEIPLGPLEYHVTLLGPLGALLGPAAAFQVVFVASAMLAFVGHGGFTVIGLNALLLGAGAAMARPAYRLAARRWRPAVALGAGAVAAQIAAGAAWLLVMGVALGARLPEAGSGPGRLGWILAIGLPLWAVAIVVEALIAAGMGRFLERVRPDLLPSAAAPPDRARPAA
jgi:cobalt/nickel transport system permease protein